MDGEFVVTTSAAQPQRSKIKVKSDHYNIIIYYDDLDDEGGSLAAARSTFHIYSRSVASC
jgi:hypothetical protein